MASDERDLGGPSRRDFLKVSGIGALTMAIAGCNESSEDGTDGGDGNQTDGGGDGGTGTPNGGGGDEDGTRDQPFVATPAAVETAFVEEADGLLRATFRDERYTRIEGVPGVDAPEEVTPVGHAVTYGHEMQLPDDGQERQPTLNALSAGALSLPNPDVEAAPANPYAERSLSELVTAGEENLLLAAAGLGPTVEWVNDPVSVQQSEAEFAEGTMTVETFVGPVSAGAGPDLPDADGFLDDAAARRPRMTTVHTARGVVGGNVVLMGMIEGWRRPPTMGPPPTEIGPEMADLLADVYEDVVQAELFRRVLGEAGMLWGHLACNLDEMGPPPEDVDRTVEYSDYYGLDARAQVELGYPDEKRSSSKDHATEIVGRTAPGVFDCESFDPDVHDEGEDVHLTIEQRLTAYPIGDDGAVPFGVIASPRAELAGEEQNPLVDQALNPTLFTNIWNGVWDLVNEIVPFDDVDWGYNEPTEIETFPNLFIEGRTTEAKGFEGTVEYVPEGENTSEEATAYLYLARMTTADEAVLACAFSLDTGTDGFFDSQAATSRLFENAVGDVVRSPGAPSPWVGGSVDDLNLVQICRNTRLETASGDVLGQPDPDLVEGRFTAAPFDVSTFDGTTHTGKTLEYGVFSFDLANRSGRFAETILDDSAVDALDTGTTDPDVLFDRNGRDGDPDNDVPVFELQGSDDSVTLDFQAPSGHSYDETTLSEGSDYSTTGMEFLRVGFITVSDPENGANYGDGDGGPTDYEETVDAGFEFLKRTFPGGIAAYRHDGAIEGVKNLDGSASGNETKDYRNGRVALERIAKPGNNNWNYSGETMAHKTTESDARSQIRSNGFDVWVIIVPARYYQFHRDSRPTGLAPGGLSPNRLAVAAVEGARYGGEGRPDAAETVAQEIAHRLGNNQYQNPTSGNGQSNPLAQRDDGGTNAGNRDFDHARHLSSNNDNDSSTPRDGPGVVSRAYSLAEGEFVVPTGHEWDGGYQVEDVTNNPRPIGSYGPTGSAQRVGRMEGYMSYSNRWVWTDSIVTQDIIDGNLNRASGNFRTANVIFGGLNEVSADAGGDTAEDPSPSVSDLQVSEATVSTAEDRSPDADAVVEVALFDPNGEQVAATTVAAQTAVDGHGVEDNRLDGDATFDLEFPPEAVEMTVAAETGFLSTNPITRALSEAYDRLPPEAFPGEPAAVREQVDDRLASVDAAMAEGAFGAARDELTAFVETELAGTIDPEFDPAENEYGQARTRALFDEMIGRLDGLAGDGGGGGGIEVGEAPPWTEWVPAPSELPVFADSRGFYQYDVDSVLNAGNIEAKAALEEPMANPFFGGYFATFFWQELASLDIGEEVLGPASTQMDVDPAEVPAETGVLLGNVQLYLGSFDTDRLDRTVAEGPFSESDTPGVYVHDDESFAVAYDETYVVGAETVDEVVTMLETGAGDRDRWHAVDDEVEWLYDAAASGDFTLVNHFEDDTISTAESELVDFSPFTAANGLAQSASLAAETVTDATTAVIYPSADAVELGLLQETLGADALDREIGQDGRFVQVRATFGE